MNTKPVLTTPAVQPDAISQSSTEGLVERLRVVRDGLHLVREKDPQEAAWNAATAHTCDQAASTIEALTAERDEADRRAGAAERKIDRLEEAARKEQSWLMDAKISRGATINDSFDQVWAETCSLADRAQSAEAARDQALAQVGRLREALEPFAEPHFMGDAYVKFVENAREALADLTLTPGIRNED